MIVDSHVFDDFGRSAEATSTYLRYKIKIGYEDSDLREKFGRLVLISEVLDYITEGAAVDRIKFPLSVRNFRDTVVTNRQKMRSGFISTEIKDGQSVVVV